MRLLFEFKTRELRSKHRYGMRDNCWKPSTNLLVAGSVQLQLSPAFGVDDDASGQPWKINRYARCTTRQYPSVREEGRGTTTRAELSCGVLNRPKSTKTREETTHLQRQRIWAVSSGHQLQVGFPNLENRNHPRVHWPYITTDPATTMNPLYIHLTAQMAKRVLMFW